MGRGSNLETLALALCSSRCGAARTHLRTGNELKGWGLNTMVRTLNGIWNVDECLRFSMAWIGENLLGCLFCSIFALLNASRRCRLFVCPIFRHYPNDLLIETKHVKHNNCLLDSVYAGARRSVRERSKLDQTRGREPITGGNKT